MYKFLKGEFVIHCDTLEKARDINGRVPDGMSDRALRGAFELYGSEVCLNYAQNSLTYAPSRFYREENVRIKEYDEVIKIPFVAVSGSKNHEYLLPKEQCEYIWMYHTEAKVDREELYNIRSAQIKNSEYLFILNPDDSMTKEQLTDVMLADNLCIPVKFLKYFRVNAEVIYKGDEHERHPDYYPKKGTRGTITQMVGHHFAKVDWSPGAPIYSHNITIHLDDLEAVK